MANTDTIPPEIINLLTPLARSIVTAQLEAPAVFFLELQKPVSGIFHTGLLLAEPIIGPLFGIERIKHFELLLSDRKNIECLISLIESFSNGNESAY